MDLRTIPDEDLVVYVREVDLSVYREVVDRYDIQLLRYARNLLGNELTAHTVVQESFISVYKNINAFNPRLKLSNFLYRAVHQEALGFISKHLHHAKKGEFEDFAEEFISEEDIETEFSDKELIKHIQMSLHALPIKYREPLILHFFEQKSYDEIVGILQISASAVAARISVGKSLVKKHVETKKNNH